MLIRRLLLIWYNIAIQPPLPEGNRGRGECLVLSLLERPPRRRRQFPLERELARGDQRDKVHKHIVPAFGKLNWRKLHLKRKGTNVLIACFNSANILMMKYKFATFSDEAPINGDEAADEISLLQEFQVYLENSNCNSSPILKHLKSGGGESHRAASCWGPWSSSWSGTGSAASRFSSPRAIPIDPKIPLSLLGPMARQWRRGWIFELHDSTVWVPHPPSNWHLHVWRGSPNWQDRCPRWTLLGFSTGWPSDDYCKKVHVHVRVTVEFQMWYFCHSNVLQLVCG